MKIRTWAKSKLVTHFDDHHQQPNSDPPGVRSKWPPTRLLCTLAPVLAGLGIIVVAYPYLSRSSPPVPLPKDLDQLEPQLRAYITEQAAWVKASPREASRYATLGLVYAANALWPEARVAFAHARQLNPKEPLAFLYEAVACQELGATEEALTKLRQLTLQFPSFAPGYYRLGDMLARAGDFTNAAIAFQRLLALAPSEWRGWAGLGECSLRQGNPIEAVKLLEQAVSLDPKAKSAHHLLGQAYQRLGRTDAAKLELRLGLDAPHYPMPDAWSAQAPRHMKLIQDQIDIAREYNDLGRPDQSVGILSAALSYNPTNVSLLNNLAIAYNQCGQPGKAKALLLGAAHFDFRSVVVHVTLAASCLALDQKDEAMEHANRAIELGPKQAFPHIAKANILLALERDSDALAELETALRCDPQNAQLHLELGDICLRNLKRPADALEHYRRANELDPTMLPVLIRLTELNLQMGHTNDARIAFEAARQLAPAEPTLKDLEDRLRLRSR